jgi:hypothetical protein
MDSGGCPVAMGFVPGCLGRLAACEHTKDVAAA